MSENRELPASLRPCARCGAVVRPPRRSYCTDLCGQLARNARYLRRQADTASFVAIDLPAAVGVPNREVVDSEIAALVDDDVRRHREMLEWVRRKRVRGRVRDLTDDGRSLSGGGCEP